MIVRKEKKKKEKRAKPYLLGFCSKPVSLLLKKVKQNATTLQNHRLKLLIFPVGGMFNPVCFVDVNNPLHKLPQSWGEWCKRKIKSLRHIRDTYKALSPINKAFLIVKEIIFTIQSVLWRFRKVYYTSEFRFRGVFLCKLWYYYNI